MPVKDKEWGLENMDVLVCIEVMFQVLFNLNKD